ncbi:MAG: hypothetical protein V4696_10220 [Pseudomonadota bacterium]
MSTSGITDWGVTAGDLITEAMSEIGALNAGEVPEQSEYQVGIFRFNTMLKTWAGKANLFREASGTIVIAAGTGAGTLPQGIRDTNSVRHVVSPTYERPLAQWNRAQYYSIPNRATVGNPSAYYLSNTIDAPQIHIWPVPAVDVTLHLDYSRGVEIVTDPTETLDIPQEWYEAALYGLASRIANTFGATRIDPGAVSFVTQRAETLYQQLLDRDRPDSYFFEPYD